jgi:plasmid stability protein
MAHLVLNDVDPKVIEELRRRAEPGGRAVEEEAKRLLEGALGLSYDRALRAARRIRAEISRPADDSADSLREDRDR